MDSGNPKTGMTHAETKQLLGNHFEEFVNRKTLNLAEVNFAPEFVDHGSDVPLGRPPGSAGAKQYVAGAFQRFPDVPVQIEDLFSEDESSFRESFWRIARPKIFKRWAFLKRPLMRARPDLRKN
jgi:hypothetical protein